MSTPLYTIADEVVSRYGDAAKFLLSAYDAGVRRAVSRLGSGYEQLLASRRVPLRDATKQRILRTEQNWAALVVNGVGRVTSGADRVVDMASERARQGVATLSRNTDFVVGALQHVPLPAARLSLKIASQMAGASKRLAELAASGPATSPTPTTKTRRPLRARAARKSHS